MSIDVRLTGKQKRKLRSMAHPLKPAVQIGRRGITEAVALQVDTALTDHELIKVRLSAESPLDRNEAANLLAGRTDSELAGMTGRVLILYRPHPDHPRIRLDDGARGGTIEEPVEGATARPQSVEEEPA